MKKILIFSTLLIATSFTNLSKLSAQNESQEIQLTDSVTFSWETGIWLTETALDAKKCEEELQEWKTSNSALRSAIDAQEIRIETCQAEKRELVRINDELRLADETCEGQIQIWVDEAKRQEKQKWIFGGAGLGLSILAIIFGR